MDEKSKNELIDTYLHAYNNFDIEGMLKLLHEEINFHNISGEEVTVSTAGKQEFFKLADMSRNFFSSREQVPLRRDVLDNGNVRLQISFNAVVGMDLPNGLKQGQQLQLQGVSEFAFEDKLIKSITDIS
ncbi:hypothetical protein UNDYM_4486 [Undibacterium sp. YM2]|uniref:nuclear transport factor 2 family protein n=1 Tax=Undibacterium sp. YM2 TaxID=2058625 RepID=UPI001331E973|nr:nuclear transport factor 2 family protein [Undibacterium sp. YM2]BBB68739.1 hypothetical protein UNDYM_4486 [Undibacterium sp. YM2]